MRLVTTSATVSRPVSKCSILLISLVDGAVSNLNWTNAEINSQEPDYIDVSFTANEGEMHWVIFDDLAGAYQYFVNRALPVLGEFRTLFRLDNTTFTHGRTNIKDEELPPFDLYFPPSVKVQDETWQLPNGTYITKYDFSDFIKTVDYFGVYGKDFGSWYIHPRTKDYINGDQLKQELMVHRESSTGDVVQLNMIHGTHFQASSSDAFPDGKIWGPWLWYLNDGSQDDAAARTQSEWSSWPYAWFNNTEYQSRGSVTGHLTLSDGRPAAGAAVFLGDNNPNKTALDMGSYSYYTGYADETGAFTFDNVLTSTYGLQAWADGGAIADVSSSFLQNDVTVSNGATTDLGDLTWGVSNATQIFRIGDFDRTAKGFQYGGAPYQYALVENCPANTTFTVGTSTDEDWCFGQSALGTWNVVFEIDTLPAGNQSATLTVSLAGYSSGVSSTINVNGVQVGNLSSGSIASDPCLYRSATAAGEWHLLEFEFPGTSVLKQGTNTVAFVVDSTTQWRGFMWDAVKLAWS